MTLDSLTRNESRVEELEHRRAPLKAEIELLKRERERRCGTYEDFGNDVWCELNDRIQKLLWELDGIK